MNDIKIMELAQGDGLLDQVEALFLQLYEHMTTKGLLLPFVEGGEKIWRAATENTLGRFSALVVAVKKDDAIGFAHGQIRFAPKFLGDCKIGFIAHIFVSPQFRAAGIGERLIAGLEDWFKKRGVHSYELQVLCQNDSAVRFFNKMGYKKELLQMRKYSETAGKHGN